MVTGPLRRNTRQSWGIPLTSSMSKGSCGIGTSYYGSVNTRLKSRKTLVGMKLRRPTARAGAGKPWKVIQITKQTCGSRRQPFLSLETQRNLVAVGRNSQIDTALAIGGGGATEIKCFYWDNALATVHINR